MNKKIYGLARQLEREISDVLDDLAFLLPWLANIYITSDDSPDNILLNDLCISTGAIEGGLEKARETAKKLWDGLDEWQEPVTEGADSELP
ncbi:hypothetical protein ACRQFN_02210 [Actinotignum sp. GS-2025e]|uniref:hypothetical protein n=1 Tax=unclassified Actinotignum TaxID=2632702 RepID=UPI003F47FE2D